MTVSRDGGGGCDPRGRPAGPDRQDRGDRRSGPRRVAGTAGARGHAGVDRRAARGRPTRGGCRDERAPGRGGRADGAARERGGGSPGPGERRPRRGSAGGGGAGGTGRPSGRAPRGCGSSPCGRTSSAGAPWSRPGTGTRAWRCSTRSSPMPGGRARSRSGTPPSASCAGPGRGPPRDLARGAADSGRRGADRPRARDRRARCGRPDEQGGGVDALPVDEDRRAPPLSHLREARDPLPDGAGPARERAQRFGVAVNSSTPRQLYSSIVSP